MGIGEQLREAGMSERESRSKETMFVQTLQALRGLSGAPLRQVGAFFVPGRIEVLGKHTDYAGGRSLLCAAERGFCVAASVREDARVRMLDIRSRSRFDFMLNPEEPAGNVPWGNYAIVVGRRIARNFHLTLRGADLAFASDLPPAAGMSSSSALMIAVFLVLSEMNGLTETEEYRKEIRNGEHLAGYLGCVENGEDFGSLAGDRGVGTFGGSEDQTAILCSGAGRLSLYSFCPVRHERDIPFPGRFMLAVGASGIAAEKAGSARGDYNRISLAAKRILEIWRASTGRDDGSLAAASQGALEPGGIREALLRSASEDHLYLADRLDQFLEESTVIIPSAADALARHDLVEFGKLVDRSQRAAERLLRNQIPETIALVRMARELGALAASAFGAGFGGSVWALVEGDQAQEFIFRWAERYRTDFPVSAGRASFFLMLPGPPALHLGKLGEGDIPKFLAE